VTDIAGTAFGYNLTRDATGRIKTKTESVAGSARLFAYTYDHLGRLRTVTRDGSLVEEYRYDNNGNRSYQMNAELNIAGRTFSHSVEDHTNVESTTVTTPAGLSPTTSIDKAYGDIEGDGRFETVTHTVTAGGKTATVRHDVVGASWTITSPEGRTTTATYDTAGNVATITEPLDRVTRFTAYDEVG
jgi:YD repeat-containing protein